jgi:hypothetical protein
VQMRRRKFPVQVTGTCDMLLFNSLLHEGAHHD